jgi:hypothetical protein
MARFISNIIMLQFAALEERAPHHPIVVTVRLTVGLAQHTYAQHASTRTQVLAPHAQVVVRFNHVGLWGVANPIASFNGQTDMFIVRITNNDTISHYSELIGNVRSLSPQSRVLGMVGSYMESLEDINATATELDWDGVLVDPQPPTCARARSLTLRRALGRRLYASAPPKRVPRAARARACDWLITQRPPPLPVARSFSTGFSTVLFLSKAFPSVPVVLLGFDSHADQPQHHGNNSFHDFAYERVAFDRMVRRGLVQRCGV